MSLLENLQTSATDNSGIARVEPHWQIEGNDLVARIPLDSLPGDAAGLRMVGNGPGPKGNTTVAYGSWRNAIVEKVGEQDGVPIQRRQGVLQFSLTGLFIPEKPRKA